MSDDNVNKDFKKSPGKIRWRGRSFQRNGKKVIKSNKRSILKLA